MKPFFQVFVLFFVFLSAHGNLVINRCGDGSSYWCKNLNTAKECGKISECKNTVWARPMQNTEVCDLCKDAVKALSAYIGNNKTEQLIKGALLKLCSDVPIQELSDECTKAVTENFDMLYEEVVTLISNGELLCGLLGLCTASDDSDHIDLLLKKLPDQLLDALNKNQFPVATVHLIDDATNTETDGCSDCEAFLNDVRKVIESDRNLVSAWKELARVECEGLGHRLNQVCQDHMERAIGKLVADISGNHGMATICRQIDMCHFRSHKTEGNDMCADCKNFFEDWKTMIMKNNTFLNEFVKEMAEFYCLQEPHFLRKQCSRYVAMAIKISINRVMQKTPTEICEAIDFCSAPELIKQNHLATLVQQMSMTANGDQCTDCTTFLTDLQGLAKTDPALVDRLTSMLKAQCDQLGGLLADLCRNQIPVVVKNLLPQFIIADVGSLCTTILMCKSPPIIPAVGGDACNDCIAFAQDWQVTLAHNETKIDDLLDQAALTYCNQLPFFREKCDEVAKQSILKILDYVKKTEASVLCTSADLCGPPSARKLLFGGPQKPVQVQKQEAVTTLTKESKKVEDPVSCLLCRVVVHEVDKLIDGNRTEAAIQRALDMVCNELPSEISKDCTSFIDKYGKDVIDLFIDEVESGIICSRLMLCSAKPPAALKEVTPCELCTAVLDQVDVMVKAGGSEKEIVSQLDQMCVAVPAVFRAKCKGVVNDIINDLVKGETPKAVCADYDFCLTTSPKIDSRVMGIFAKVFNHISQKGATKDDVGCTLCKFAFGEVENLLKKYNMTKDEIVGAFDQACAFLPGSYRKQCTDSVNIYVGSIVQALIDGTPPAVLCATFAACPPKTISIDPTSKCELCIIIGQELDHLLTKNSTEEDITHALNKVCSILPDFLEEECKELIKSYGGKIIQALLNHVRPELLCSEIGLCSSKRQVKQKSSALCLICTTITGLLEDILGNNSTEEEIKKAVETICDVVPSKDKASCDQFIEKYGDEIISLLAHLVPPREICTAIHLCSAQKVAGMDICLFCKAIAAELDQMISSKSTQKEIEDALEKVCHLVTGQLRDECVDFIKINGPAILDLLAQEVAPSLLCPELHMCPKKKVVKESSTLCDVCKIIIDFLDQELDANATRADIERALDHLCDRLPAELEGTCDDIVKQYTPEILALAEHIFEPDYVCIHLDLCDGVKKPVLVGGNPCTYGPSYWCKNEQTAKECHAMDHCRLHVWN